MSKIRITLFKKLLLSTAAGLELKKRIPAPGGLGLLQVWHIIN